MHIQQIGNHAQIQLLQLLKSYFILSFPGRVHPKTRVGMSFRDVCSFQYPVAEFCVGCLVFSSYFLSFRFFILVVSKCADFLQQAQLCQCSFSFLFIFSFVFIQSCIIIKLLALTKLWSEKTLRLNKVFKEKQRHLSPRTNVTSAPHLMSSKLTLSHRSSGLAAGSSYHSAGRRFHSVWPKSEWVAWSDPSALDGRGHQTVRITAQCCLAAPSLHLETVSHSVLTRHAAPMTFSKTVN